MADIKLYEIADSFIALMDKLESGELTEAEGKQVQEELENAQLEGVAGGGLVKVVVNGKKVLQNVSINPGAVDTDDIEMLEDLILAAYNSACEQADKLSEEKLGAYNKMGGMF